MKIGIIGCGAMGSVYASFFSSHDFNVSVIDKWKEHTNKISSKGLKITGPKLNKVLKDIDTSYVLYHKELVLVLRKGTTM